MNGVHSMNNGPVLDQFRVSPLVCLMQRRCWMQLKSPPGIVYKTLRLSHALAAGTGGKQGHNSPARRDLSQSANLQIPNFRYTSDVTPPPPTRSQRQFDDVQFCRRFGPNCRVLLKSCGIYSMWTAGVNCTTRPIAVQNSM